MILVVGSTGFLGSEICRRLTASGKSVRGLVRSTSDPEKVERLKAMGVETIVAEPPTDMLEPLDGLEWQYHSHAAKITPRGTLLLFDNGNFRALPPKPRMAARDSYSRAVEFAIDAKAKTAREVWKYGGPKGEIFFSPFISEADLLPTTGNVLITDGGRVLDKEGHPTDDVAKGYHFARLLEVTRADPPEKVFELLVGSGDKNDPIGWSVYRSERLPVLSAK